MKTIKDLKKRIEEEMFPSHGANITVDGKETFEIVDMQYAYLAFKLNKSDLLPPPVEEEVTERNFIIKRSLEMEPMFTLELNVRRACFVNNYDGDDNHCLSYFQYNVRNNKLSLFVYIRSQNFDTNFIYDNQTFLLAYHELYMKLRKKFPDLERGKVKVMNFSLHKYI